MSEYRYRAKDMKGRVYAGVLEADGFPAFYHALREEGKYCIRVQEVGANPLDITLGRRQLKMRELSVLCRQFSTMLNSGVSVIKCLDVLYQQTEHKHVKAVILDVYDAVQRGESLSRAMEMRRDAFPELLLNMVAAGEASGTLDTVMSRMADQYEREGRMQNQIRQALIYPAFLLVMSLAVVAFLLTFILPTFLNMYGQFGGSLPATTRVLLSVSHALTAYWYLILIILLALGIGIHLLMKNEAVRRGWDAFRLRVPVFGRITTVLESARFTRTLASLFSSGLPIIQSIEIVARVIRNTHIRSGLLRANEDIRRGVSISESVRKLRIFPTMLSSMMRVGEESGNMDGILNKTAAYYDEEADAAIRRLISLIEPVMIVVLALIVGFIIVSVITPIYGLYSQIGSAS